MIAATMSENDLDFDLTISDENPHNVTLQDVEITCDEVEDEPNPKSVAFHTNIL